MTKTTTKQKLPVTMRALTQRINRALKSRGSQQLKMSRTPRLVASVGLYYIVDRDRAWISKQNVDPEALARELGCMEPWEALVYDAKRERTNV